MCVYIGWILVFAASWGWFCFYSSSSYNKTIKMGELSSITCWNWNFSRSHKVRTNFTKNITSYKKYVLCQEQYSRPRYFHCSLNSGFSAFKVIKLTHFVLVYWSFSQIFFNSYNYPRDCQLLPRIMFKIRLNVIHDRKQTLLSLSNLYLLLIDGKVEANSKFY